MINNNYYTKHGIIIISLLKSVIKSLNSHLLFCFIVLVFIYFFLSLSLNNHCNYKEYNDDHNHYILSWSKMLYFDILYFHFIFSCLWNLLHQFFPLFNQVIPFLFSDWLLIVKGLLHKLKNYLGCKFWLSNSVPTGLISWNLVGLLLVVANKMARILIR